MDAFDELARRRRQPRLDSKVGGVAYRGAIGNAPASTPSNSVERRNVLPASRGFDTSRDRTFLLGNPALQPPVFTGNSQDAWNSAYRRVGGQAAKPVTMPTGGGGTTAAMPRPTSTLQRIRNIPTTVGGSPAASDIQASRQRLAAQQMGGVPLSIAQASYQGRADGMDIFNRAMQPKSPAETTAGGQYSPLAGDAQHFRDMLARSQAGEDGYREKYAAYQSRRDDASDVQKSPYCNTVRAGVASRLGLMDDQVTDAQVADGMKDFTSQYTLYQKGNKYRDNLDPGEFAYRYFNQPDDEEIKTGINNLREQRLAQLAERGDAQSDGLRRRQAIAAFNQYGVMPTDPALASSMVSGMAVRGNPFASQMDDRQRASQDQAAQLNSAQAIAQMGAEAQMYGSDAQYASALASNQAQLAAAQARTEADKYTADRGFASAELEAKARQAEAEATRAQEQQQFELRQRQFDEELRLRQEELGIKQKDADFTRGLAMADLDPEAQARDVFDQRFNQLVSSGMLPQQAQQAANEEARRAFGIASRRLAAVGAQEAGEFMPFNNSAGTPVPSDLPVADMSDTDSVASSVIDAASRSSLWRGGEPTAEDIENALAESGVVYDENTIGKSLMAVAHQGGMRGRQAAKAYTALFGRPTQAAMVQPLSRLVGTAVLPIPFWDDVYQGSMLPHERAARQ